MGRRVLGLLAVAVLLAVTVSQVNSQAASCNSNACSDLSSCRCSIPEIPGGLDPSNTPQFVAVTFDDAVTTDSFPYYEQLSAYKNPNGCGIEMSFFVTHAWNDYTLVNKLWNMGHDIASHSVTHKDDQSVYWNYMDRATWAQEAMDMKTMLAYYAQIPIDDIRGFRAPYLEVGGNDMYGGLYDAGFEWDCSWPTNEYTPWYTGSGTPKGTLWPYTLEYLSNQEQTAGDKPTESFPGLWVNPMTQLEDNIGLGCAMLSYCNDVSGELSQSGDAVFEFLKRNFDYHYYGDRGPMGVYMHYFYFQADATNGNNAHHDGFERFLSYVGSFSDAYVVGVDTIVEWTKDPHSLDQLGSFAPLQCGSIGDNCPASTQNACHYTGALPTGGSEVWMSICGTCPNNYPWLGNPYGN